MIRNSVRSVVDVKCAYLLINNQFITLALKVWFYLHGSFLILYILNV